MKRLLAILALALVLWFPLSAATELKHTVAASGGDFTTLLAAIAHINTAHADLVGADVYATVEISGAWAASETGRVNIPVTILTDATHYLHIYTIGASRHAGIWDATKHSIAVANDIALAIYANYVRLDGLQIMVGSQTADSKHGIYISTLTASANDVRLSNLIVRLSGDGTYNGYGLAVGPNGIISAWNIIIYGVQTHDAQCAGAMADGAAGTLNLYSSTVIGGYYSILVNNTTAKINCKNVYCGGSSTEDYKRSNGTLAKTNCASEDQSADDTGTGETATNCIAAAVLIDTDTFINVGAGTENYHLAADGNSPLQNVGTDTSGEGAPLNFTTDIDAETRSGTWEIGVDDYVPAGGPTIINNILIIIGLVCLRRRRMR